MSINSVLLVDDDPITNFINTRLIKKMNIAEEFKVALNGKEALQKIEEFCNNGNRCPEMILLDINMPVMDGFEFLRYFEKMNIKNKEGARIVILTTSNNPGDLEKLKKFNVKGFINKPLTEEKLKQVLNETNQVELS